MAFLAGPEALLCRGSIQSCSGSQRASPRHSAAAKHQSPVMGEFIWWVVRKRASERALCRPPLCLCSPAAAPRTAVREEATPAALRMCGSRVAVGGYVERIGEITLRFDSKSGTPRTTCGARAVRCSRLVVVGSRHSEESRESSSVRASAEQPGAHHLPEFRARQIHTQPGWPAQTGRHWVSNVPQRSPTGCGRAPPLGRGPPQDRRNVAKRCHSQFGPRQPLSRESDWLD